MSEINYDPEDLASAYSSVNTLIEDIDSLFNAISEIDLSGLEISTYLLDDSLELCSGISESASSVRERLFNVIMYLLEEDPTLIEYFAPVSDDAVLNLSANGNYLYDLDYLMNLLKSADEFDYLSQIDGGMEKVMSVLSEIQDSSSGRWAAVNSALAVIGLAAENGFKIIYNTNTTLGGAIQSNPYISTSEVSSGIDCNNFVSWAIDKGTINGFQWRSVGGLKHIGEEIDVSDGCPGDILVSDRHVRMIIANDSEANQVIVAEAVGVDVGVTINTYNYNNLDGFKTFDLTNVYNNSKNTDRDYFHEVINNPDFIRSDSELFNEPHAGYVGQ